MQILGRHSNDSQNSRAASFKESLTQFVQARRLGRLGRQSRDSLQLISREEIASGGTAFIYRLKYSNHFIEVEKILSPRFQGRMDFEELWIREFEILKNLTHPLIVRAYQLRERDSVIGGKTKVLVLEYIEGVNLSQLFNHIAALNPEVRQAWADEILRQLVSILSYLRHSEIIHGDLAPENLVLQPNGHIKLIDFGVARRSDAPQHDFRVAGRVSYRAPELKASGETSFEGDVFAAGKIYEQILGEELSVHPENAVRLETMKIQRQLPSMKSDHGWFKGVQPMPPKELMEQPAIIRAKTKILKLPARRLSRATVHALILLAAFPFLTSWLPQVATITINSLPSSMIFVEKSGVTLTTPIKSMSLPSGKVRLLFIVPSQQNRRVIRELDLQPNEHVKLFEDFRKN